jgi:acyl carrier protein
MVIYPKYVNKHNCRFAVKGVRIMFEKVKELLVEELSVNPDDVTLNAELVGDLGINSLELADLVLLCEEKFDLEISDDDIHKFVTIGDVVEYLSAKADL